MVGKRTVIIGAGVVGAALADELSALGWTDITVVDQGDLPVTGGSSSHAPGLVFRTNSSKTMAEMARYTVEKFAALRHEGQSCFLQVGGLEVATSSERLAELQRRHGWVTAWGIEAQLVDPAECTRLHPLLDESRVLGGLHVPTDGLAKAVWAVAARIEQAESRGVRFLGRHEVLDLRTEEGRVTAVVTDQGEIEADVVVCCAGIWGPKVAAMAGMTLPLTQVAHQLAWTAPLPALEGQSEEAVAEATLGATSGVDWAGLRGDYSRIRAHIENVVPGFEDYETRVRARTGFVLPHPPRDSRAFDTPTGRARFTATELDLLEVPPGHLVLQTMRSHDQFNTTSYGLSDRYRGSEGGRQVVLLNERDLEAIGLAEGDLVDIVAHWPGDDVDRRVRGFRVVGYDIPVAPRLPTIPRPTHWCRSTRSPSTATRGRRSRSWSDWSRAGRVRASRECPDCAAPASGRRSARSSPWRWPGRPHADVTRSARTRPCSRRSSCAARCRSRCPGSW